MRTTFTSMYRDASAGIEASTERLTEFQRQVSTGRRMERPSDDPAGTSTAIAEHAGLASIEQYKRAASSVGSKLTVIDTVLSDMVAQLTSASVAVTSARGTTASAAQREAAAQQLESVRDSLFDNFNASFQGAYLFGGADTKTPPFVKNGSGAIDPYRGSTTEVQVDIDRNRSVKVGVNGNSIAQGTDTQDVFAVMQELVDGIRAGDETVLRNGLEKVESVMQRVLTAQSRVGADMGTIDEQQLRLAQMKIAGAKRLEKVEAADMVEAISGMNQAQAAYEAALGAVSAVTRVSLMDYLR